MNKSLDIKKTKKRNRNKVIKSVCAPHKQNDTISCFDKKTLINMIEKFNKNRKDKILPNYSTKQLEKKSRRELWNSLYSRFREKCNDERCWRDTYFKNMNKLDSDLKPLYPESWNTNRLEWLSTSNIESVCEQFEKSHKDFMFIGAVPIDFNDTISNNTCVVNELCRFNLKHFLKSGKHKLGIVFNLDRHYESGSHWVAMYADFKKGKIIFFDSYGYEPYTEISNLMEILKIDNEKLGVKTQIIKNQLRHQYKYSECGMYCIYFIKSMLEGKSYTIMNNRIPDDKMEHLRTVFYYKAY